MQISVISHLRVADSLRPSSGEYLPEVRDLTCSYPLPALPSLPPLASAGADVADTHQVKNVQFGGFFLFFFN